MERYGKYKDSGVEWIGEIPSQWEIKKIKYLSEFKIGGTPSRSEPKYFGGENIWISISDMVNNGLLKNSKERITNDGIENSNVKLAPKGSLLYSFKLSVGVCSFAGCDLYTNEAIASFIPNKKINLKYLLYNFNCGFENNANENIYGAKLFNSDLLKNAKLIYAPLKEQEQIVAFLDDKTGKIDDLLAKIKKKIELIKENRTALINHCVTKGLNPNSPMKDSGVEWIGDIPTGWECVKLKYLCSVTTGGKDTQDKVDDGLYPFYVRSQKVERINSYSYEGESVLTAGDGVGVGKVFHYVNGKFEYHQRVYKFSDFRRVYGKFFFLFMKHHFIFVTKDQNSKSTVDSIRRPLIDSFRFNKNICNATNPPVTKFSYVDVAFNYFR